MNFRNYRRMNFVPAEEYSKAESEKMAGSPSDYLPYIMRSTLQLPEKLFRCSDQIPCIFHSGGLVR